MVQIPFTLQDYQFCASLADKRSSSMGHQDTKNSITMTHSSQKRHYIGVIGELAYSKFSGLPVDVITIGRGDDGNDFQNGVNVKCTDRKSKPDLLFLKKQFERKISNYYVLSWIHESNVYLVGWAKRLEIESQHTVTDFGYGETLVFKNDLLYPMHTFEEEIG